MHSVERFENFRMFNAGICDAIDAGKYSQPNNTATGKFCSTSDSFKAPVLPP